MDFASELEILLQARFTLIVLVTAEEARAIESIKQICQRSKRPLVSWDLGDGFEALSDKLPPLPSAPSPIAALEQIEKIELDALFILKDFDECWCNPQVKRKLRNVAQKLKRQRKSILVTTTSSKLPEQLRDETFIADFPLPQIADLEQVLDRIGSVPGARMKLSELGREKLLRAALGLNASQALRAFSKAVVKDGGLDDRHIEMVSDEKRQVIRESQALEFFPTAQTVDDIGGLDALKEWLRVRERAFTEDAERYMLPPPKGMVLLGIPGTGKSLTAKTVGAAWRMPVLRLDVGALFGSLVGESEERTRRALKLAETVAPCVLWIDELDKAFGSGDLDCGVASVSSPPF